MGSLLPGGHAAYNLQLSMAFSQMTYQRLQTASLRCKHEPGWRHGVPPTYQQLPLPPNDGHHTMNEKLSHPGTHQPIQSYSHENVFHSNASPFMIHVQQSQMILTVASKSLSDSLRKRHGDRRFGQDIENISNLRRHRAAPFRSLFVIKSLLSSKTSAMLYSNCEPLAEELQQLG
jgi:hypothetical protein